MELKEHKSALAALATLGVTVVAAGATAIVKYRQRQKARRQQEEQENQMNAHLTADQMMVYNEAVRSFITLNNRIYDLRQQRKELQPVIQWLATGGDRPDVAESLVPLANDIERFLTSQVPFIDASLSTISDDGMDYFDCVHAPVGGYFDDTLDEEPTGAEVNNGDAISAVLKLGYFFPESTIAVAPQKSIVLV